MEREKIYREDVLNLPIKFHVNNEHDMNIVRYVLDVVMTAVRELPAAEDEKPKRRPRKKT